MMVTLKLDPARSTLIWSFMNSYLKLTALERVVYDREVKKIAPPEREMIMTLTNEWFDQGKALGEALGKAEGILSGQYTPLKNAMPRRFRAGADEFIVQLGSLSPAILEGLVEHLSEFKKMTDVKRWLAKNA